jgi:uncharacterized protein (UPF0332 family)
MGFDWGLYVQLAKELLNEQRKLQSTKEEYLRTVVSRSYYGIFCIARNHLISKGLSIPKVDSHNFVRNEYIHSPNPLEYQIGNNLRRLWRRRIDADYQDNAVFNITEASTAYQMAYRTIGILRQVGAIP